MRPTRIARAAGNLMPQRLVNSPAILGEETRPGLTAYSRSDRQLMRLRMRLPGLPPLRLRSAQARVITPEQRSR